MTVGSMIALRLRARLAAAKYLSAIHLAVLDICHNSVEPPFIQHGPDLRAFIPRIADLKVADFVDRLQQTLPRARNSGDQSTF